MESRSDVADNTRIDHQHAREPTISLIHSSLTGIEHALGLPF